MIQDLGVPVGTPVQGEWVTLTAEDLQRYQHAAGLIAADGAGEVPLGFLFATRGEVLPDPRIAEGVIGVHGGHLLRVSGPLTLPLRVRPVARIERIFEKSGRRGLLTVIARSTTLLGEDGQALCLIEDHHILRRPPAVVRPDPSPAPAPPKAPTPPLRTSFAAVEALEPGETIAVEHRRAPDASAIRRYAEPFAGGDPLFTDGELARRVGFDDVIVPGPLQSALLEALVTCALPTWRLHQLACTFRISLLAAEAMTLSAVVTELDPTAATLHLDLTIENAAGERAATGSAVLRPRS